MSEEYGRIRRARIRMSEARTRWLVALLGAAAFSFESWALGPYSWMYGYGAGLETIPAHLALHFGDRLFSPWAPFIAGGVDRYAFWGNADPFNWETLFVALFQPWLANGLHRFVQYFIAIYFTSVLCRKQLGLDAWHALLGGVFFACFSYFTFGETAGASRPSTVSSLDAVFPRITPGRVAAPRDRIGLLDVHHFRPLGTLLRGIRGTLVNRRSSRRVHTERNQPGSDRGRFDDRRPAAVAGTAGKRSHIASRGISAGDRHLVDRRVVISPASIRLLQSRRGPSADCLAVPAADTHTWRRTAGECAVSAVESRQRSRASTFASTRSTCFYPSDGYSSLRRTFWANGFRRSGAYSWGDFLTCPHRYSSRVN